MTETTTAVLDLSQPVTREQFETAMTALKGALDRHHQEHYTGGYYYGSMVSARFKDPVIGVSAGTPDVTDVTEDMFTAEGWQRFQQIKGEEYARELRETRARILGLTRRRRYPISLERANEALAAAGLPQYELDVPEGTRMMVYIPAAHIRVTDDDHRAEIRRRVHAALLALGTEEDPAALVEIADYNTDETPVRVPESETLPALQ